MTLRAGEWEDLRADDGSGTMHLAEVRERELSQCQFTNAPVSALGEEGLTMKSMVVAISKSRLIQSIIAEHAGDWHGLVCAWVHGPGSGKEEEEGEEKRNGGKGKMGAYKGEMQERRTAFGM